MKTLHVPETVDPLEVANLAQRSRIAFAFIVRDGATFLEAAVRWLVELGRAFREARIFYVENDSTDETRHILESLGRNHPGMFRGLTLTHVAEQPSAALCGTELMNCERRVQLLASLRQRLLDLALEWRGWDVLAMVDVDFKRASQSEFKQTFATGLLLNASAMFALSVYRTTRGVLGLYDKDATRPYMSKELPAMGRSPPLADMSERADSGFDVLGPVGRVVASGSMPCSDRNVHCLLRVRSAFGGFGLYYAGALRAAAARYDAGSTNFARSGVPEHVQFNLAVHASQGEHRPMFLDPRFRPQYDWGTAAFWIRSKNNAMLRAIALHHRPSMPFEAWLEDSEHDACRKDHLVRHLEICRLAQNTTSPAAISAWQRRAFRLELRGAGVRGRAVGS